MLNQNSNMRILVTGADGMLGNNLVRLLVLQGHEISVLIHPSSNSFTLNGLKIRKYFGDILKSETLTTAVAENEVIIHAAASTSVWPTRSEKVRSINIEGTQNVIDVALNHNIKRLIYVGSASSVNNNGTTSDKHAFPFAKYQLDYIDSKFEALKLVLEAVKTKGLPALAILPTFMIGPYDALPGSGRIILKLANRKVKFIPNGGKNFIYVNDVAAAIVNSLTLGEFGRFYIAGNENLTFHEFFNKAAKIMKQPEPRICVPDLLVKLIGLGGSLYGKIFNKEPVLTYQTARISCDKHFISNNTAVTDLNMPQTNIDVAIQDCYDWFVNNGYVKK
jgi:dihydroflavonol-4-reductase